MMSSIDRDLDEASRTVLEHFRIDHSDSLLALAFGSRARDQQRPTSDFDLIFVVRPKASYPDFAYQRLKFGDSTIDANIIQPDSLDLACRKETGWAYRLYGARPIRGFTRLPPDVVDAWLQRHNALIRHPAACRRRLLWHLADCRALLRSIRRLQTQLPGLSSAPLLSTYLMIEALFQMPLIQLNLLGLVPFAAGDPWSSARVAGPTGDPHASDDYGTLLETITRGVFYADVALNGSFANNLKQIRDRCRSAVVVRLGYVFGDGLGKTLAEKLKVNGPLQSDLAEILAGIRAPKNDLVEALDVWTGKVLGRARLIAKRSGRRISIPRRKSKVTGTRLVEYRPETARLKIILPTGGCRVPTCTFCMLPYLARAKGSLEPIITSAADIIDGRNIRQVAIYTDGSFFDDRELTNIERLSIAHSARQWGATELLVESLPRFLTPAALEEVIRSLGPTCRLRIGIGLQSANPSVRTHITGTPITQSELMSLLELRRTAPFALRLYLLANKPMMTTTEDLLDLDQTLDLLDRWLAPEDVVTVNPLLPTRGTLVEQLEKTGYWRPLTPAAAEDLVRRLQMKTRNYSLEFGPIAGATCTDSNLDVGRDESLSSLPGQKTELDGAALETSFLPWSLLGGFRSRNRWAVTGGCVPRD